VSQASLYRRHRPQTFDEVVGQDHVVRTLRNAVAHDKVHHAYLFVGSRGTGKTSMAKILARCLNCERGPTTEPCGECESCRTIAASTSLDVIEMDAASNRSVDDIRDLRERVGYAPAAGRWKVYILDEAHMLTKEAWNAFLKTLEEPPPNTLFVLATTEAHKVMPTIVDRCQRFDFQRPAVEQISEVLRRVASAEGIEIEDGAVAMIARAATGSFRDALGTLDQLVAYGGASVELDDVLAVLGVADAELIFETVDAVAADDPAAALGAVERLSRSGRDVPQFIRDLVAHLRQLLVLRTTGEPADGFTVTAGQDGRMREQAERLSDADLVGAIDDLSAALAGIREGDDARISLEVALLKAARPELKPTQEAILRRIERLERRGRGAEAGAGSEGAERKGQTPEPKRKNAESDQAGAEPEASAGVAAAVAGDEPAGADAEAEADTIEDADPLDLERIRTLWPAVVDQVRQSGSVVLSALFENARPVDVDDEESVLRVGFPASAPFNKKKAEAQPNRERLADAVRQIIGRSLRPVYVLLDSDAGDDAVEGTEITEEELIERLKAEFDATEYEAGEA
jgi:DNA polymerase-3 subunit gamma/tau